MPVQFSSVTSLPCLNYVATLSKLHLSSVLLLYYVRLSHILLNTVLLCLVQFSYVALNAP